MSVYNNNFRMQDLFCNKKLAKIIPQFDRHDMERDAFSDYKIFTRCQQVICGMLGGEIQGDRIEVHRYFGTISQNVTKGTYSNGYRDKKPYEVDGPALSKPPYRALKTLTQSGKVETDIGGNAVNPDRNTPIICTIAPLIILKIQ